MLFEDQDGTSTEAFVNYKITLVEMTIAVVPNQLYIQGMWQYQQWDEINKYIALTSKRDKQTDKVAKDINFSDTNIEKCLTERVDRKTLKNQLSPRSHPRNLLGKRTTQKNTIIDITSDSQVNSNFQNRWSPACITF